MAKIAVQLIMKRISKINSYFVFFPLTLTALFIIFPLAIYVFIDKSPFGGDQSWYAIRSIELYETFLTSPGIWLKKMINISAMKAPGIIWIGQFFVPIGLIFGSIDSALLTLILIMLALSIILIYLSIYSLSERQVLTSIIVCFFIASSPLFLALFNYYLTEPMQLLSFSWIIFILSRSSQWSTSLLTTQLLLSLCFSMLAKTTSPLYFFIFIFYITFCIFKNIRQKKAWSWKRRSTFLTIFFLIPSIIMTTGWYYNNFSNVIMHISTASKGPVAAYWGKVDSYFNTLKYWSDAIIVWSFCPFMLILAIVFILFALAKIESFKNRQQKLFLFYSVLSLIQIIIVILIFSIADNREPRYLLPLLPCIAIIVGWAASKVYKPVLILIVVVTIVLNWSIGWVLALTSSETPFLISGYIKTLDRLGKDLKIINEIVTRTCNNDNSQDNIKNVLAIDPLQKGDWLAPVPASYESLKLRFTQKRKNSCNFYYIGNNFFGANVDDAWEKLSILQPSFLVISDPNIYPPSVKTMNETLNKQNFLKLFEKILISGKFIEEKPLKEDNGILIFKLKYSIAEGRRLSDIGDHIKAIETLEAAKIYEYNNPEYWANLQLAYLRFGKYESAIKAGKMGLKILPTHYWILKSQTICHNEMENWDDVIYFGKKAINHAPDKLELSTIIEILSNAEIKRGMK